MTYDYLTMRAVCTELQQMIVGAQVQQISQPRREEIVLSLYHEREERHLLLSCHPQRARIHLTGPRPRRPQQPPPFCMLLRKYLTGARIKGIVQPPLERVLEVNFTAPEGLPAATFIAEIMGRRSNLLLLDSSRVILGAVQIASREQNPRRAIQPGELYSEVPGQQKLDPLTLLPGELGRALHPHLAGGSSPEKALLQTIAGLSPLAAKELVYRSRWDQRMPQSSLERLQKELQHLFHPRREVEPTLFAALKTYAPYRLKHCESAAGERFATMNELLDRFYENLVHSTELETLQGQLRSRVNRRRLRLEQKLGRLKEDLEEAAQADHLRICGETLLTYAGRINRGETEAVLPDLYHPDRSITISLDPSRSAVSNAQRYFRRYRKISDSRKHLGKQIAGIEADLAYYHELLYTIEQGDRTSLEEIRGELIEAGLLKSPARKGSRNRKKRREEPPRPLSLRSSSGVTILVGRNNRQNDYLTFKLAGRRDIWLHARGMPGSHLLIKGDGSPLAESDLLEAALLAAHHSRGRDLSAVAVDYTEARHVRRAPGGRPGFVLYDHFKTITVNPQEEQSRHFLKKHSAG